MPLSLSLEGGGGRGGGGGGGDFEKFRLRPWDFAAFLERGEDWRALRSHAPVRLGERVLGRDGALRLGLRRALRGLLGLCRVASCRFFVWLREPLRRRVCGTACLAAAACICSEQKKGSSGVASPCARRSGMRRRRSTTASKESSAGRTSTTMLLIAFVSRNVGTFFFKRQNSLFN